MRDRTSALRRREAHGFSTILLTALLSGLVSPPALVGQAAFEPLILSPDPGEAVPHEQVMVAVSFVDPEGSLDPESVRLRVGDTDVTGQATITPQVVTWRPETPPPAGRQRATLSANDRDGEPLLSINWTFVVEAPASDAPAATEGPRFDAAGLLSWARMRGSVIFENHTASVSGPGSDLRRDENFLPRLWLNATGTIRPGWRYSTRIHMSGYESGDRQPVNRYRFTLRSPNLDLALGDVHPQVQSLILQGRRVRGVQGEVRGGPVGIAFVTGQSHRPIEGILNPLDAASIQRMGTYGRSVHAVRPTIGTGERFQVGLTAFRARDDVGSISNLRTDAGNGEAPRSATPLPKDNFIIGADVTSRFLDGRILLQYENAMSLYANDITEGAISRTQLDSTLTVHGYEPIDLDPERWERFFTINASVIPMDLAGFTNVAHRLRTSVRAGSHFLSAELQSVGGSYHTLGHPGLQRDRKGIRLRDSFSLLDHSMAVSMGLEHDEDNLDGVKPATTTSRALFAELNWQRAPHSPGISASIRLGSRRNGLSQGEMGARDESNWTIGAGFILPVDLVEDYRTRVGFNWSLIRRSDPINPSLGSSSAYYLGSLQAETLDRRSDLRIVYGLNRSEFTELDAATNFHRLSLGGRHQLTTRWAGLLDGTFTRARTPAGSSPAGAPVALRYDRDELMAGGEFEWTTSSYVSFQLGIVRYADDFSPARNTREVLTRVRVNRPF